MKSELMYPVPEHTIPVKKEGVLLPEPLPLLHYPSLALTNL